MDDQDQNKQNPDCNKLRESIENEKFGQNESSPRTSDECDALCQENQQNLCSETKERVSLKKEPEVRESRMSLNLPRCYKCNCPKLVCECEVDVSTGVLSAECSQGPYVCRWVRDDEQERLDPCILIPSNHQCPVDCEEVSYICDPECECTCSDVCECEMDDDISIYDDYYYDSDDINRMVETAEEEEDEPEWNPIPIDMTPMEYRIPNPDFGCCRTAPLPEEIPLQDTAADAVSAKSSRKASRSSIRMYATDTKMSPTVAKSKEQKIKPSSSKVPSQSQKQHSKIGTERKSNSSPRTSVKEDTKKIDPQEVEEIKKMIQNLF